MSATKSPDELGKDADGTNHAKSTAERADNQREGNREEEEKDYMGSAPPLNRSGSLPDNA